MKQNNAWVGLVAVLIIIVFIYPQVSFASWWNPSTWFNHHSDTVITTPPSEFTSLPDTTSVTIQATDTGVHNVGDLKTIAELQGKLIACQRGANDATTGINSLKQAGGIPVQIVTPPAQIVTPVTKSRLELEAEYKAEMKEIPYAQCVGSSGGGVCRLSTDECAKALTDAETLCSARHDAYTANMNTWVNAHLAQ